MTRVLVADDDPANADLLTSFLTASGYAVAAALDGNRALEMGLSGDFGLVILDVHMPLYEGTEVLEMLRARYVLHPVKVIALTGDSTAKTRADLEEQGVDAYMVKPVELRELLEKVKALIGAP